MGRYSPTVRPDAGSPLDFSHLSSALREMQDTRLRRRQQKLYEEREAEDRRVQGERERVAGEERANDVRRRGGTPILSTPIGHPTLRDLTPARESRVPQALGGGALQPMLPQSSGGDYRPEGTGRYMETVDGTSYMVDPLQPLRLQDKVRQDTERAKLTSSGRVARTLLSTVPTFKGTLGQLSDEDLGRMPLSEIDTLSRAGTPKPLAARDDIAGQAKALGVNVAGMSPGEAAQRVAMAERRWETANRPAGADDENRALIRDERRARGRTAFADRVVRASKAGGGPPRLSPADEAEAKRLGVTPLDYQAAWQRYRDNPSTAAVRAERAAAKSTDPTKALIDRTLAGDDDEETGESPASNTAREERAEGGRAPSPAQLARAQADPQYAEFLRSKGYALR